MAGRGGPGGSPRPPLRDHRPGRAEDDDQRAELGRALLHGRLRGRELADVDERRRGPAQCRRRGAAHDRARHRGEVVPAERRDRDAADPAARLASSGAARARRRRADLGVAVRLRPDVLPQRARAARARQRAVLLPPEARVASRGAALGARVRVRGGRARRAARLDPLHRSDRDDPRRVRDGGDPLRAPRLRLRAQRGALGLHVLRDQEVPDARLGAARPRRR